MIMQTKQEMAKLTIGRNDGGTFTITNGGVFGSLLVNTDF